MMSKFSAIDHTVVGGLRQAGITTQEGLLRICCDKAGRRLIADQMGLSESLLLNWVGSAGLARVTGISIQHADLLEASGVDTVSALAQRTPANLTVAMMEVNNAKHLVRQAPTIDRVEDWVVQAKALPRAITH
jgi:hypothetical protein